jgi:hypothetical protein
LFLQPVPASPSFVLLSLLPSYFSTPVVPEEKKGEKERKREGERRKVVPPSPPVGTMLNWRLSTVEEVQLEDFATKGFLPPKAVTHWRAPPAEHEELRPEAGEIVSFLVFHEHGLRYPAPPFLLRLLNEWEVELQHLNPNGVPHIVGFITLCEGFLGIDPHVNLLRIFFLQLSPIGKEGPEARTGLGLRPTKEGSSIGRLPGVHPRGLEPGVA